MSCKTCGGVLHTGKYYCSIKCQVDYQYETYIQRWLSGEEDGVVGKSTTSKHIKRWVRKNGHHCWRCGWAEVHPITGNIPVELEHKDGDFKNNRPSNLELLCPNCHSLTLTYRALNKSSGRTHR